MKKLIIALLGTTFLQAQTANVNLNVKLHPIIAISVSQPTVTVDIDTEQKYLQGAQLEVPNHIRTFSTVPYNVTVRSLDPALTKADDNIDLNSITISSTSVDQFNTYFPVVLSEAGSLFIETTKGGGQKSHNVTYTVGSGLWDKSMGSYTANIQYEITVK